MANRIWKSVLEAPPPPPYMITLEHETILLELQQISDPGLTGFLQNENR